MATSLYVIGGLQVIGRVGTGSLNYVMGVLEVPGVNYNGGELIDH